MGVYEKFFTPGAMSGRDRQGQPSAAPGDPRTRLALEALGAHVMIADENGVIVSMNASVMRMLRNAEADIRKDLPHFAVDRLVGTSFDAFHRNPAHQQNLLGRLRGPHEASIKVGGREFALTATPLVEGGTRVGTVVEWRDDTETNALRQRELTRQREAQAHGEKLSVITTALDTVSSNVMMADADGTIFYANRAVLELLRRAEDDIRAALPAFAVDSLIGQSIDCFHRNPGHQRAMLERLAAPFQTSITVGRRHFDLLAAPVFAADGKRLGTVVEWQDRTAQLQLERAVETTMAAAIAGDLDQRIPTAGYDNFLARIAGGINDLLTLFSGVLATAETALGALARGDLTCKVDKAYEGRYRKLRDDINATVDRLCQVVTDIGAVSREVKQVARELNGGNAALSQRTEEQAASLEETSAAMEQITRAVEQNSTSADIATNAARAARSTAEGGGGVIRRAIAAMDAISESSRNIDEIVGVIDGIAFQTNLLALNAAVEAARAGDQGRGFAVVADEVRNLAGRSAKAAKEISQLIRASSTRVREGEALVNESGTTLDRIVASVREVDELVSSIAGTSHEQAKGIAEINRAVQEMDAMTQQNAALVEEATASSDVLHQRAEALSSMVAYFMTEGAQAR